MKTILTFAFAAVLALDSLGQNGNSIPECPDNSLFSQTAGHYCWQVFSAWSGETEISTATDDYSVTSPFNSIRFWGGWAYGVPWVPECAPSPAETFHIEIFNQDPSTPGATPIYSFDKIGFLTMVNIPLHYKKMHRTDSIYGYHQVFSEPLYQIDLDLGTDITVLNGWISIRSTYTPGRVCEFGIAGDYHYCSDCTGGFKTGVFTQQSGGGYTSDWQTWPGGMIFMCLSYNGVNFSGSPLRVFNPDLYTWNGLADAWSDQGVSAAATDNFTVANYFDKLTLWGGYGIGSYGDPSCTAGTTETFVVDIFTQDPATGGTPVQSLTKTATLTPTGYIFHNFGNQPIYKVEMTFNPEISITSGWIRVQNVNAAGRACKFGWLYSSNPAEGSYLDGNLTAQPGGLFFNLSQPCPTGFASAGPDDTVYFGYPPMSGAGLQASGGLWYSWSPCVPNMNNACDVWGITVRPTTTTTYTVEATNADGCVDTDDVTVTVVDVRCGPNMDKVKLCYNNKTLCVPLGKVQGYLAKGAYLGSCNKSGIIDEVVVEEFSVSAYPNPFTQNCVIQLDLPDEGNVSIEVMDMLGRKISRIHEGYLDSGSHQFHWKDPGTAESMYFLNVRTKDEFRVIKLMSQ